MSVSMLLRMQGWDDRPASMLGCGETMMELLVHDMK